jgi:hypothetical protein
MCSADRSAGTFTIPAAILNLLPANGYGYTTTKGVSISTAGFPEGRHSMAGSPGIDAGLLAIYVATGLGGEDTVRKRRLAADGHGFTRIKPRLYQKHDGDRAVCDHGIDVPLLHRVPSAVFFGGVPGEQKNNDAARLLSVAAGDAQQPFSPELAGLLIW